MVLHRLAHAADDRNFQKENLSVSLQNLVLQALLSLLFCQPTSPNGYAKAGVAKDSYVTRFIRK